MTATEAKQPGLPQHLNYHKFVAHGVIQNKDGAFLTAWEYYGPDQEYAEPVHMVHLAEQINQDIAKLSSGWMLQAEPIRMPVVVPRTEAHYPDLASQLVAEERAAEYEAEGKHYETKLVLTLTWLPPSEIGQQFSNFFFGKRRIGGKPSRLVLLGIFQSQAQQLAETLGQLGLKLHQLTDDEIIHFLRYCVTGENRVVGTEESGSHLDHAIGTAKWEPWKAKMGKLHVRVVGVFGFPRGVEPQLLDDLLRLPFSLRVSQRFIFLGTGRAVKELEVMRKKWGIPNWYNPKRIGIRQTKNITGINPDDRSVVEDDEDAEDQLQSVRRQKKEVKGGRIRAGYYTLSVILQDEDEAQVEQQAAQIVLLLNRKGFTAVLETDNAPYALRASWPGHGKENVRHPQLTSRHFTRLWCLSSPWRGPKQHPSPLYPPNSGPLIICKSTGYTPFFFTPRLHSFIIGPSEAGKTVILNSMSMGQFQYDRGQVATFDLDGGAFVPNAACGGQYYDLDKMKYAPLALIDKADEYTWALDFCERLAKLRDFAMTPRARTDLARALRDLSKAPISHRHMTGLLGQLQTHEDGLRAALNYYAGSQPGAVLDGQYSAMQDSHWLAFDMEGIQKKADAIKVPVFLAQLHLLERRLSDGRPTQMSFEEGWRVAGDVLLRDFIEESSATMRKKVVSLNLVLHSPGDLSLFPHADRLLANIGTYIFLPNPEANSPGMRKHYSDLGLGSRVIKEIAEDMRPRRDYLVKEGNQMRKFQLPWGPFQNTLLGCNGRDEKAGILKLQKEAPQTWFPQWLQQKGQPELAQQWEQRQQQQQQQSQEAA